MKTENPAVGIVIYDDVFKTGNFIELLEQECLNEWGYLQWDFASQGNYEVNDHRTSRNCYMSPLMAENITVRRVKQLRDVWLSILKPVDDCVRDYREDQEVQFTRDQGYSVLKYGAGAEYKTHHDHHPDNSRIAACVVFLNDVEVGGELEFPLFNVKIKPKEGRVVMFPANFPYKHTAHPCGVDNDEVKYSIVTWYS